MIKLVYANLRKITRGKPCDFNFNMVQYTSYKRSGKTTLVKLTIVFFMKDYRKSKLIKETVTMNIGIDIDDTLSNSFEVIFADSQKFDIEELGNTGKLVNYGKVENHSYIETIYPHWTKEQTNLFWEKFFINMLTKATPKTYAPEIVQKMQQEGNRIIIITSRYEVVPNKTLVEYYSKQWLAKNNIPYDEFVMNAQDKLEVAQKANVNLFIDDSIDHCKRMQEGKIKTLLYTSIMNQGVEVPDLERVYSWPQIYDKYVKLKTK